VASYLRAMVGGGGGKGRFARKGVAGKDLRSGRGKKTNLAHEGGWIKKENNKQQVITLKDARGKIGYSNNKRSALQRKEYSTAKLLFPYDL